MAGQPGPRIGRGSLVVGDPATDPARGMRRLPGARVEAITVARVLGTTPLLEADADEVAVLAGLPTAGGLLHLATHGLLDDEAPDLSALALAGRDELTVAVLLGVGLDTDLAVLSACDSGRGDITATGDVVGLARGLLAAGVRRVVVSLWPVDDRVGCLTMAAMASALRRASRWRARWPRPNEPSWPPPPRPGMPITPPSPRPPTHRPSRAEGASATLARRPFSATGPRPSDLGTFRAHRAVLPDYA